MPFEVMFARPVPEEHLHSIQDIARENLKSSTQHQKQYHDIKISTSEESKTKKPYCIMLIIWVCAQGGSASVDKEGVEGSQDILFIFIFKSSVSPGSGIIKVWIPAEASQTVVEQNFFLGLMWDDVVSKVAVSRAL